MAKPSRTVVILSAPRTGSNLLVDLLRSIKGVDVRGEILDPAHKPGRPTDAKGEAAVEFVTGLLGRMSAPVIGFKAHLDQLRTAEITPDQLRDALPGARFLLMYRRDLFAQFVSAQRALATGQWSEPKSRPEAKAPEVELRIDGAAFREYTQRTHRWFGEVVELPWYDEILTLAYEDLAGAQQETFDRLILPFLDLPATKVETGLRKQIRRPPSELVANYAEIADVVADEGSRLDLPAGWPGRAGG